MKYYYKRRKKEDTWILEQVQILDKVLTSQQDEKYYFLHALPYDTHKYTQITYFMLFDYNTVTCVWRYTTTRYFLCFFDKYI